MPPPDPVPPREQPYGGERGDLGRTHAGNAAAQRLNSSRLIFAPSPLSRRSFATLTLLSEGSLCPPHLLRRERCINTTMRSHPMKSDTSHSVSPGVSTIHMPGDTRQFKNQAQRISKAENAASSRAGRRRSAVKPLDFRRFKPRIKKV